MNKNLKNNLSQETWNFDELTMKYPMFVPSYNYLLQKYNKFELSVSETLREIQMSNSDFFKKKKAGRGIPCYRQRSDGSRITFPVICVALFLATDFREV